LAFQKGIGIKAFSIMIALGFLLIGPLSVVSATGPHSGSNGDGSRSSSRTTAEDWPMFRYSANRNGVTTAHGPSKATLLWSNSSSGGVYSSPAIVDGRVFFGSDNGNVYAFDALTGKLLWSNLTSNGDYGASSSPAVSNGNVFIYSNADDSLYCFNASTGARKWKQGLGSGGYGGSSPLVLNSKVYVGSADGHLYVRNENDGSASWNFAIGASSGNGYGVDSAPSVVGDRVYFGGGDSKFYAVNITSHALVWSYSLASYGYPSGSVIGNVVYTADGSYASASCANCYVYAFDTDGFADGNDGWTGETLTGATNGDIIWRYSLTTGTTSTPTYYKGYIFVGSMGTTIYALNSTTGTLKWSYSTGGNVMSSASVSNDIFYIGSKDRKLYAFDYDGFADGNDGWTGEALTGATNGDIIWNYTCSGEIWATPAVSNGMAYITDLSNKIWAIGTPYVDTSTPQVLSTSPANLATNVSLSTAINAHMSQALDPLTVNAANFTLKDSLGNPVAGTVSYDAGKMNVTFNPGALLKPHEKYSASIKALKNLVGNMMSGPFDWSFTTINAKPVLSLGKVSPTTGNLTTHFQFSVLYADPDNDAPNGGVRLYLDGSTTAKTCVVNTSATPATYHDGNYVNGEAYIFNNTFTTGGNHTYQFKATDGIIENVTLVLKGPVVVTPNKPPVISTVPDQLVTEDIPYTLNMVPYVTDPDNKTSQLKLTITSQYLIGITGLNASFLFPASAKAEEDIVFKVSDGITPVQTTVKFFVTYVDDPPVLTPFKDVTVNANEPYKYDLAPYINDEDTPLSSITVSTNSSYITASGLNLTLNYPRTVHKELVNVTVKDAANTVYGTFWVTVNAPPQNKAPTIDALPDATPTEDTDYTYDLTPYIHDDGSPSGILTISLKTASKSVTITGMKLKMLYGDGISTEILDITVSDGDLSTTAQLHVRVTPVNDAPILKDGHYTPLYNGKDKNVPSAYQFNVTCGDIDSSNPTVTVLIDNVSNTMVKGSTTVMTAGGQTITAYYYVLDVPNGQLTKGSHAYQFKADDMSGAANAVVVSPTFTFVVEKTKTTQQNPMATLLPYLLIFIVVIVVVIVVAVMLMRRKKARQAMPPPQYPGSQQPDLISGGPAAPPAQPTQMPEAPPMHPVQTPQGPSMYPPPPPPPPPLS